MYDAVAVITVRARAACPRPETIPVVVPVAARRERGPDVGRGPKVGEGVAVDPVAESKRLDQAKAEGKKPNETPVPTIGKGASGGGFLGIF